MIRPIQFFSFLMPNEPFSSVFDFGIMPRVSRNTYIERAKTMKIAINLTLLTSSVCKLKLEDNNVCTSYITYGDMYSAQIVAHELYIKLVHIYDFRVRDLFDIIIEYFPFIADRPLDGHIKDIADFTINDVLKYELRHDNV